MNDCATCDSTAIYIIIDGGHYSCASCILDNYGFITRDRQGKGFVEYVPLHKKI